MNERDIHINRAGSSLGPYPESRARELLLQGELLPADHAWCSGEDEWKPLSELLEKPVPFEGGKATSSGKRAISKKMKIGIAGVCALILFSAATVIAVKKGYLNAIIAKTGLATTEEDPLVIALREELGAVDTTLEKELDKIRATNEPVTIQELTKWGKVPPDDKNAALAFNKIVRPEQAGKDISQIFKARSALSRKQGVSIGDLVYYDQELMGKLASFVQKYQQYLSQLYKLSKTYNLDEHPAWFAQEPVLYDGVNNEEYVARSTNVYIKLSGSLEDLAQWVHLSGLQGNTEAAVEGILTMIFLAQLLDQTTDWLGQQYIYNRAIPMCIEATKKLLMIRTLNSQQLEKLQMAFNKFNTSDILHRDLICNRCILITQSELARKGEVEKAEKMVSETLRKPTRLTYPEQKSESEHNLDMTLLLGFSSKLISLAKEGYPSRYQAQSGPLAIKLNRFIDYMKPTKEEEEKGKNLEEELKEEYPEINWDNSEETWKGEARKTVLKKMQEISPRLFRYVFFGTGVNSMYKEKFMAAGKIELKLQMMKSALAIERYRWNNNGKLPKGLNVLTKNDGLLNAPFDPLESNNKKLKYVILGANEGYQMTTLHRADNFTDGVAKHYALELNFKKRLR